MTTREAVSDIMKRIKPTKDLENVQDIVEGGYIDSFELMTLIATLADECHVDISIDEIVPENFNSLDAIAKMVDTLRAKQG
ncbi:MAG: acyl carrier protein [Lachnospiraceae bacterium]|nr:acyl carrier protein [Lachnospiraceae bacterium]